MTPPANSAISRRESAVGGTARTFAAEMLMVPSGLFVAWLLARTLSLEEFGHFTLAVTLIAWIEWSLTSLFARSTIKFVSEADDVRPVAATVLRLYFFSSVVVAAVIVASADLIAAGLKQPQVAPMLRLLAVDVPLFALAQAHRNILIGQGRFAARANGSAARWSVRASIVALCVWAGWGVTGALLGSIGASLAELWVCRRAIQPSLRRSDYPVRAMWAFALPLLGCSLVMRSFDKLDIFMLTAMGAGAEPAGLYGAAQNLALAPGLFATAFSPTLLSAVARARRENDLDRAARQSRDAFRAVALVFAVVAPLAGAASEVMGLFYGAKFLPAAPLFALLAWGATCVAVITVCGSLLIAFDRPGWALALIAPLPIVALLGHRVAIPAFGMKGAATVTLMSAALFALVSIFAARRLCRVPMPWPTFVRATAASIAGFVLSLWPLASNPWLLVKLPLVLVFIVLLLSALGEWEERERTWFHSLWRRGVRQKSPVSTG